MAVPRKLIAGWYFDCVRQLSNNYGRIEYDHEEFEWVGIYEYRLPRTFREKTSRLLIVTPKMDIDLPGGYHFYLDHTVHLACQPKNNHLYKNDSYNDRHEDGFARVSFHLESFMPAIPMDYGDTLLDICIALYTFLGSRW